MGRTICLLLSACLALGLAGPVPGPNSHQEILDMILHAKPEDNDIHTSAINILLPKSELEIEAQEFEVFPELEQEQQVLEQDDIAFEVENVQDGLVLELIPNIDQTQIIQEESILIPEEEEVQDEPELSQFEEPLQLNPYNEEIVPVYEDEPMPFEEITPENEDQTFIITDNVDFSAVPIEDEPLLVIEEEEIPIYEEEPPVESFEDQLFPIRDETEFQLTPEDTIPINFEDEDQVSTIEIPEGVQEFIMVVPEEAEFSPPISEDPVVFGSIAESYDEEAMPFVEEDESVFGSFVPQTFEDEASQEDIIPMPEEPYIPVYFDTFNAPQPVPAEMFETADDNINVPVEIHIQELPPMLMANGNGNPFLNSEVSSLEMLPIEPYGSPYEEDFETGDEILEDYYIYENENPVEDGQFEQPEEFFRANADEYFLDNGSPLEENAADLPTLQDMLVRPGEEPFITEDFDYENGGALTPEEFISNVDATEVQWIEPVSDSVLMVNEELPFQNDGDIISVIEHQNNPSITKRLESIFMIEPEGFNDNNEEPVLEIIHIDNLPVDQEEALLFGAPLLPELEAEPIVSEMPDAIFEFDVQTMTENEEIVPIAEFLEDHDEPIIIEQESYFPLNVPAQHPITFPEEMSPKHNLPVFPHQWGVDNFFHPPSVKRIPPNNPAPSFGDEREPSMPHSHSIELSSYSPPSYQNPIYGPTNTYSYSYGSADNLSPYYSSLSFHSSEFDASSETIPSNGGSPSELPFMMGEIQTMADMPITDMSFQSQDLMSPSGVPDMTSFDGDDFDEYDDDDDDFGMYEETDNHPFARESYQNIMFPNVHKSVENVGSFEMPSLPDSEFQHDFHGPNTFPLNIGVSDFAPDSPYENFSPYEHRLAAQNIHGDIHKGFPSSQPFREGPYSSKTTPNVMALSPKIFFSVHGNTGRTQMRPNEENTMDIHPDPDNTNQRHGHYDIEVPYLTYETSYSMEPDYEPVSYDIRYRNTYRPKSFDRYQRFSYNRPSYGDSRPYQSEGYYPYYPTQPRYPMNYNQPRYPMNYNYRDQYDYYHPYNYPTPTW